jgi:hypothetical protein
MRGDGGADIGWLMIQKERERKESLERKEKANIRKEKRKKQLGIELSSRRRPD